MLYAAYQARADLLAPWRAQSELWSALLREPMAGPAINPLLRTISATAAVFADTKVIHDRPDFGIDSVESGGQTLAVTEEVSWSTPFGTLLHFRKDTPQPGPRVLLVAPMAGHFATLLRNTLRTLLIDHDVYITDWHNARDVPREAGKFGLDEYIDHVIAFLEHLGPGSHMVAVCQPCAAALAAVAVMAGSKNPATPKSMTLMAGPIDTRINPTAVNDLATEHPIEWFERNLISTVPGRFDGGHRRVYPGFMQLMAFMSMNLSRHVRAHWDLISHLARGETEKAEAARTFYDEYFAVLDLPAEFYLETVERVFQKFLLPRGLLEWRGQKIDLGAIRKTALLTVEGEKDDICSMGQTVAAHDLCPNIKPFRKSHHLQPGVGHYGVFSGSKWQGQIYPIVRNVIAAND
ncbi:MAG: polyhydroxyalkanoate depolymerase [Alphaproteobacteria bacterium]|nr:polyhydroxyalkanoate depolymerase [Alphaproteobacteria bacterium]